MFYLDANGDLKLNSLEVPPGGESRRLMQTAEDLLARVSDEAQNVEVPAKRVIQKARASFRLLNFLLFSYQASPLDFRLSRAVGSKRHRARAA